MSRRLLMLFLLPALGALVLTPLAFPRAQAQDPALTLTVLGTYATGVFDEGASEIAAYDPVSQTVYVTNGDSNTLDLLNISDPAAPTLASQVDLEPYGAPNHVAVYGTLVAVAVEGEESTDPGQVVFFDTAGNFLSAVEVGALPDMVVFTPDGAKVLTANEGEPNGDYTVDPEGSVSIVDVATNAVTTVSFADFNAGGSRAAGLDPTIRIYGPKATVAQDLEPEYIAISPDSAMAYVTLQENNALAVIDLAGSTVTALVALGYKDHSAAGNGLDASNEDGAINIAPWPVFGMYQPDAIAAYQAGDGLYLVTANEGDTRDYDGYSEEGEVSEMALDPTAFPNAADLQQEANLGKLGAVTSTGDADGDGDFDALYVPGGRSFSIWAADGTLVFDSGDQFERITAEVYPADFNAANDENGSFDDRSDNKGPEPEGLAVGTVNGRAYAFIGLERIGGVMVYDITDPQMPVYVTYVNNRDFSGDAAAGTAGDLGPEGVLFIAAENSPTGNPLLVVTHEISGSTTIYEITS